MNEEYKSKKYKNNNICYYNENGNDKIFSNKNNKNIKNVKNYNNMNIIKNDLQINNNKIEDKNNNNKNIKRAKTVSKTKYKKFNIVDLLEQPSLEMEIFNKIIVGLKDVKKTQFKAKIDNYMNTNNKGIINYENKKMNQIDNNISKNNILSGSYQKNKKETNIIKKSQIEKDKVIFPVNFLRSIDKSIAMNVKKKYRYQNIINHENIPVIIEEEILENENENKEKYIHVVGEEKKENIRKNIKNIGKMSKLFNEFNNIKEIVKNLEGYNSIINDLFKYIYKEIENNFIMLNDILISNYNLILNNISINYNTNKRNYIISFIDNTKQIFLYNILEKKYNYYNFESILKLDKNFNNSMCIEYDDKDLIFISGGKEDTEYYSSDMILIISLSKEIIELDGKLPTRKSFHSNIYFEGKLYLLGGIEQNKKCSSNCFYFSINNKKWYYFPNLNKQRANCSLCIQNKSILYVFGGRDDNNDLNSIEFIDLNDINNKTWNIFIPIDYGYVWVHLENSLIISYNNNKILICGGEDKNGNLYKETFLLDINNNNIYRGKDLLCNASFRFQGCCNNNEIFGIDLKNNYYKKNKIGIHYYNIENNEWKLIIA